MGIEHTNILQQTVTPLETERRTEEFCSKLLLKDKQAGPFTA
jgi:hypothetical protein